MDGNWNTGCQVSDVFTQLEFARKNMCVCVYLRSLEPCEVPAVGSMHLADHSLQK